MLGYDREELVGKPFDDLKGVEQHDRKVHYAAFAAIKNGERVPPYTSKFHTKAGKPFWAENHMSTFTDDRKTTYVQVIMRDVTARRQAEEAARRSLEKFLLVAERSFNGVFSLDARGKFTYVSPNVTSIAGYEPDEVLHRSFRTFIAPSSLPRLLRAFVTLLRGREVRNFSYEIVRKDGTRATVEINAYPVKNENKVVEILGTIRDVTREQERADRLSRLSQFRESIIENANVWVDVLDGEGNVLVWNRAAEEMSGYSQDEVLGHGKIWEWLYPDESYRAEIVEKAQAIIRGDMTVQELETVIRTKSGQTRIISWNSRNLVNASGEPIGSIALGRDITERKKLEEKLAQQDRMAKLGTIAAVVSHELNTPLANIGITAEILANEIPERYGPELATIRSEVKNAASIINKVLGFSRMGELELKTVDVSEIIDRAVESVRNMTNDVDVAVQNETAGETVTGDEYRLYEAFVNIIHNAVLAKDPGKEMHRVTIRSARDSDGLTIAVEDNGVGMATEVADESTAPFFTTRPEGEGTGLGLFITNWIIEHHGGRMTVESERGRGTVVTLHLPEEGSQHARAGD
jgi:PAS domain S-box-containing protein